MPDNRRQAEGLSLSREVRWSRAPQALGPPQHRPLLHSASGPHAGLDSGLTTASAKLTKLQELQDKKQTMDKILQELHSLRDQSLNNNYCKNISNPICSWLVSLSVHSMHVVTFRSWLVSAVQPEHGRIFRLSICSMLQWCLCFYVLSSLSRATPGRF